MAMNLDFLLQTRARYQRSFKDLPSFARVEKILSDRDLMLSGHVVVAKDRDRVMQVTVESGETPAAFIKSVGLNNEELLLQVILPPSDLRIEACKMLFEKWIDKRFSQDRLTAALSDF